MGDWEKAFGYLFQLALASGGALLGWLHFNRQKELDTMNAAIGEAQRMALEAKSNVALVAFEAAKQLYDHKLFAAENFVKKEDLKEAEQRLAIMIVEQGEQTLARLGEIRDRLPRRD
jgi:hypothetical protein